MSATGLEITSQRPLIDGQSFGFVTTRFLEDKFLKPSAEKRKEEKQEKGWKGGWKEGWVEGWKEGRQEGRQEERRKWAAWNQRREEAARKGEPFDEPPPATE